MRIGRFYRFARSRASAGGTIRASRTATARFPDRPACPSARPPRRLPLRPPPSPPSRPTAVVDDRLARPGRARPRARRRQGGLRRGRAARRARHHHHAEAQADLRDSRAPRRSCARAPSASSRAARTSASAAAARCSTSTRRAQVAAKQRALEDALWHLGRVRAGPGAAGDPRPGLGLPAPRAAVGPPRRQEGRRAGRLPRAEVELRRRHDVVRDPAAARSRRCCRRCARWSRASRIRDRLPQIELAVGDAATASGQAAHVLVLRILAPLGPADDERARAFADAHGVEFWLQTGGPETAAPLHPPTRGRSPTRCRSSTSSFPTARPSSRRSTRRSTACWCGARSALLDPQPGERVADFFCGLGNFTLPIARRGADRRRRRGQRRAGAPRRRERRAQRPRRAHALRRREPVRGDAGDASRRWARSTRC